MDPVDIDHLTAAQAAAHVDRARQALSAGAARVKPATIRQWASRGHLKATGLAADGRTRTYRLADVAAAELATRTRALQNLSAPAPPATQQETAAA
ncbi:MULTISPECIES: MerR family transcriptional regulator [unclassified Streptomyces]|uniref:MerR family transcriptional regulator n=1 Tax=unclassified Streptomyces TaxID=2593676 RepID=UPI0027DB5B5C|nr:MULTISPECIES: MerR family transcriptional regulator [unclassified Streptomyces]